ncbi:MAG: ribosomal large subunit methyltransferase [Chlamydiota bacterium]|jgi:23S rRNA (pseudouridine1915-N3)-methyltransferase
MFKIKIVTTGQVKESWLKEALLDYERRMQGRLKIEWCLAISEEKIGKLIDGPYIALDIEGDMLSSGGVHEKLYNSWGARPMFVIGGASGLRAEIKQRAFFRWSLSRLTLTHQMTRLILAEQLYRALEIEQQTPYHKW